MSSLQPQIWGAYGHQQMAEAAAAAAVARNMNLARELGIHLPSRAEFATGKEYDHALEGYFNKAVGYACRKVKL